MKRENPKFYPMVISGQALRCLVTSQELVLYYPQKLLEKDEIRTTISYYDIDSLSFEKYNDKLHMITGLIGLGMGIFFVAFINPFLLPNYFVDTTFYSSLCWIFFLLSIGLFLVKLYKYLRGEYTILIHTYKENYRFSGRFTTLKELYEEILIHK